jgi:dihydrofolate reductase
MGRKTFDSIGKPLPNRLNIVLSRSATFEESATILSLRSKEQVLALEKYLKGDVFIIGGATIYQEFADVIEKWIVTEIPETVEDADAFLPNYFLDGFESVEKIALEENLRVKFYERTK